LNDLINEQGHTVYVHCNSSISRSPALIMTYLCLFLKIRTWENLGEAHKLFKQFHHISEPNLKVVQKLLKKHKLFQDRQKVLLNEDENEEA